MSKNYNKNKNSTFLYAVFSGFLVCCLLPMIPLFLLFCTLFYLCKLKAKYILFTVITITVIITCTNVNIISDFINQTAIITNTVLQNLIQGKFTYFTVYSNFNLTSWYMIVAISIFMSGLYKLKLEHRENLKVVGAIELKEEIKNLSANIEQKSDNKNCVFVGINENKKKVYSKYDSKHIFACGTTGAGKTVLLANYIKSAIVNNFGLVIVDGKGDTGTGSILEITRMLCKENNRKLIVIDMNNVEESEHYNPFWKANETVCKDMVADLTDWSEEHYKANFERYTQRLIKLIKLNNEEITLQKIVDYLPAEEFTKLSLSLSKQAVITKAEHLKNIEISKNSGQIAESAVARIATLSESTIGKILDGGIDIATALSEKAVILFVLNPLEYPILTKILGRLILQDCKKSVSYFYKNYNELRKFYIFDELNVYASTTIIDLINKSRSANITNIVATQSLSDLDSAVDENFRNQIIENCNNYFVMRQNSFKDSDEWAKTLGTVESIKMTYQVTDELDSSNKGSARKVREFKAHPDEIKSLATGEAFYLSHDDNNFFAKIKVNKPF